MTPHYPVNREQLPRQEISITCPACRRELSFPDEFDGKEMVCPFCDENIAVQPNPPTAQDLLLKKPVPDGYAAVRAFIPFLKFLGWLYIIGGIVGGFVVMIISDRGWFGLLAVVGYTLQGVIFIFIAAAFNLVCGTAQNTAYLVALKEHELKNRG